MAKETSIDRCKRALVGLTLNQPILGMAAARIELLPAPAHIPTAAVDARGRVFIGDNFFATLSEEEIRFVLAHEIMHLLLYHYDRRKDRNPYRWNRAADRWINHFLKTYCMGQGSARQMQMPSCGLLPLESGHEGLNVEQLYEVEPEEDGDDGRGGSVPMPTGGCGPDGNPTPGDDDGGGQNDKVMSGATWRGVAEATKALAAQAGNSAGDALANVLRPPPARVKWSSIVRRACEDAEAQAGDDDVSFQRRNRRRQDVYIPGSVTTTVNVAVIIDTSGSVPDSSLAQAVAETLAIAKDTGTNIYLITHDAMVQYEGFVNDSLPKIQAAMKGRGGTAFEPAYTALAKIKRKFGVMVHLTDGLPCDHWPDRPPNVKVGVTALIGYSNTVSVPPWMRTVLVEMPQG